MRIIAEPCVIIHVQPDKGNAGMLLSDPNHDAKQVCIKQLWKEALGEPGNPTRRDSNFIAEVMDNMNGWRRGEKQIATGIYRGQKCWNCVDK